MCDVILVLLKLLLSSNFFTTVTFLAPSFTHTQVVFRQVTCNLIFFTQEKSSYAKPDKKQCIKRTKRIRVHVFATVGHEDADGEHCVTANLLIIVLAQLGEDGVEVLGERRDRASTGFNDLRQDANGKRLLGH